MHFFESLYTPTAVCVCFSLTGMIVSCDNGIASALCLVSAKGCTLSLAVYWAHFRCWHRAVCDLACSALCYAIKP